MQLGKFRAIAYESPSHVFVVPETKALGLPSTVVPSSQFQLLSKGEDHAPWTPTLILAISGGVSKVEGTKFWSMINSLLAALGTKLTPEYRVVGEGIPASAMGYAKTPIL